MKKLLFLNLTLAALYAFKAIKDDDIPLIDERDRNIELYAGDTYKLEVNKGNSSYVKYESDNKYIVSTEVTGVITANTIGETEITITTSEKSEVITVTVNPHYADNYLTVPVVGRNTTPEEVRAIEDERRTFVRAWEGEQGYSYIEYQDNNDDKILSIQYIFFVDKIEGVTYLMDLEHQDAVEEYIHERYIYSRTQNYINYYVNSRDVEAVQLQINDDYSGTFTLYFNGVV
ncbi:MAG: Ig-like domain-containing protein [Rikenellaceae bacterium]|nr:Ig-like domain-containing protein [Rikenellaceae bacterium]